MRRLISSPRWHVRSLLGRLGGMRFLFGRPFRLGRRRLVRRRSLRPFGLAFGGSRLQFKMARDLGARAEAVALRRWGQGGAGEGSRPAGLCARGCAHDGAVLPLTCVLKKYESESPAVAPFLRNSVLVYQPLIISAEPPQSSRYLASDARSFTERSDESASAGSKEVRRFLGGFSAEADAVASTVLDDGAAEGALSAAVSVPARTASAVARKEVAGAE